jgi:SAM-dependent methyltransferase
LKADFVGLLNCPKCGSRFQMSEVVEEQGEIGSGALQCTQGHEFPIVGGVPRFVESELYVQNFGFEWNIHARTQLDSATSDESERTFRAKTGFTPEELRGKIVLDVGCGMGRFSEVAARWGATVVGIDLSRAVDAAQRNIGARKNVNIAQANVFELPFGEGTFDYIFSIGVLHHTPNTKAAFDALPKLLRKNGKVAIWLYSNYDEIRWRFSDLYRRLTPRLPKRFMYSISYAAVPLYYVYKIPVLGLFIRWVLPASSHPKASWRVLDTFDWYSPRYQWKHVYEEVFPWFEEQGLTDIRVLDVPVALQGTKR